MTDTKKASRFDKLKNVSDASIMGAGENTTASQETKGPLIENPKTEIVTENNTTNTKPGPGLKFNQRENEKSEKKSKKAKVDQIKDRVTIVVSEATRDRLKVFCASNKFVIQNWTDETLWRAMDKIEKAQREAKAKEV